MSPLNPRLIAFSLALLVAVITVGFVAFLPLVSGETLIIVGASAFFSTLLLVYFVLDYLIFEEINKIYDTIQRFQLRDFSLSRKKINKSANPLKKLNSEIFVYATKKQREIDELKRLEQYRREFLADVSHELKTPLFAAQGFIYTLLDGAKDDEAVREKFLKKAARSLDDLDALVADLLTLSQIEAGQIKMLRERTDILALARDIFEQLEPLANAREMKLLLSVPAKSVLATADPQRIRQVLVNLLDNAVKYGKANGTVSLKIKENKKKWLLEVHDDGPGIPPEHLGRIFERFYRVEKSRSKEMGGTGLGLAIVKHIINAHKSKITVESQPGVGTTFGFALEKFQPEKIVNQALTSIAP